MQGRVDYYYLVNGKHAETVKPAVATIDHDMTLGRASRDAVPYRIDPWSGVREPIAVWTANGDRVTVRVRLEPGESSIIVLAPPTGALPARHVTATTLNNRLRVSDPAVYGAAKRQAYGLIGPVTLIPCGEAAV